MAHIAIDARIINSSTGRYVERLVTYLQEIDHENQYSILVPTKDKDYWKPSNPNFTVHTIDFPNYSLVEQTKFRKYLNQLAPDLVHFCMPQQPVSYDNRTVTTFHDLTLLKTWNSDKNWLVYHLKQLVGRVVFYWVAHKSQMILTPSMYTRDELLKFSRISAKKVKVTYESADKLADTPSPFPVPFRDYILYVGQQSDYKNIRRLAEAHQQLRKTHPKLGLVLAGRKKADALANERLFTERGYQGIIFTDFIPDTELAWLYQHCRAYVFPSLMEGFGLPGLEAMIHGAPVVSSGATCLPEVYGDAAQYFDPKNVDNMADAIDTVISDDTLRKSMIAKGYKQAQKYSWRRMAEETLEGYKEVLGN